MASSNIAAQHTPTPWSFRANNNGTLDFFGEEGAKVIQCQARLINQDANAAFIVRACNAHEKLVAALREAVACYDQGDTIRTETLANMRAALAAAKA